jgi:hypothetical protein
MPQGYTWAKSPLFDVFAVFCSETGILSILDFRKSRGGEVRNFQRRETTGKTPLIAVSSSVVHLMFCEGTRILLEWTLDLLRWEEETDVPVPRTGLEETPVGLEIPLIWGEYGLGAYWGKIVGAGRRSPRSIGIFGRLVPEEIPSAEMRSEVPIYSPKSSLTILDTGKGWMWVMVSGPKTTPWAKIVGNWACWCSEKNGHHLVFLSQRSGTWPEIYEWVNVTHTMPLELGETVVDFGIDQGAPTLITRLGGLLWEGFSGQGSPDEPEAFSCPGLDSCGYPEAATQPGRIFGTLYLGRTLSSLNTRDPWSSFKGTTWDTLSGLPPHPPELWNGALGDSDHINACSSPS